tara:strand:+ start:1992 stop:2198 length:207 start_codon:yes stop_codon:yes gene_type:complete
MQKIKSTMFLLLSIISICCESKKIEKKVKLKLGIEKKIIGKKSEKLLSQEPKIILDDKNVIDFFLYFQ